MKTVRTPKIVNLAVRNPFIGLVLTSVKYVRNGGRTGNKQSANLPVKPKRKNSIMGRDIYISVFLE